ncbi:MAG: hypothetical protein U0457_14340 [Candidatus Sericytochromatia bacterium]
MNKKILKTLLLSTLIFLPTKVLADDTKINIILNTSKENLFSSWFSGGKEFESFIFSDDSLKNISVTSNKYDIYQQNNAYMLLPEKTEKVEGSAKISFLKDIIMFEGDINNFIIEPEKNNSEILIVAQQKYKMRFPSSKSKISEKKLYKIELNNKKTGYYIFDKTYDTEKVLKFLDNNDNWEKKLLININTSVNDKNYDIIMISNDPFNSIKVQQTLKDTIKKYSPLNTLKISYGNLFSTNKESKNRKVEEDNLKENSPHAILPSSRDLSLNEQELETVSKISPIIATNIKKDEKNYFQKYTVTNVNGKNVAILGITDDFYPKARGIVNKKSKLQFEDIEKSLNETLKETLNDSNIDIIIVLTNVTSSSDKLESVKKSISYSINKYPQKQLLLFYLNEESDYINRAKSFEKISNYDDEQLYISSSLPQGIYSINLDLKNNYVSKMKTNLRKIESNTLINNNFLNVNREIYSKVKEFNPSNSDKTIILPDKRDILNYATKKNLSLFTNTDDITYSPKDKTTLAGNILIDKYFSELVILPSNMANADTLGSISTSFFSEWFSNTEYDLIQINMLGKDIKNLYKLNKDLNFQDNRGIITFIGGDIEKNIIRGRNINDNEYYNVITTDIIYLNLLFNDIFSKYEYINKNAHLKEETFNYLENIVNKYDINSFNKINEDYLSEISKLFESKNYSVSTRWTFSLKNLETGYNKAQTSKNDDYGVITDSRISNPDNYDLGFSGKLSSIIDSKDLAFGLSVFGNLKQAFFDNKEDGILKTINKKTKDDINSSLDFQLKFISIGFKESKISLMPYLNSTYSTEFFPSKNQETNLDNPRRSEINTSAGIILYPSIVNEFRVAFITRYDFNQPKEFLLNPGIFSSFNASYDIFNNITLDLEGNYRYYFPTKDEPLQQLSSYGEINSRLSLPLWDKFRIALNLNTFLFRGNLDLRNKDFGIGFSSNVGLSYSFDTKPFYWVAY